MNADTEPATAGPSPIATEPNAATAAPPHEPTMTSACESCSEPTTPTEAVGQISPPPSAPPHSTASPTAYDPGEGPPVDGPPPGAYPRFTGAYHAAAGMYGDGEGARLGASMVWIPDFTGDGTGELAIGQPGGASNIFSRGYVMLSQSPGESGAASDLAVATFVGASSGDRAGQALAVGDVNGDGQADVWIGAPQASEGGVAYLMLGGTAGSQTLTSPSAFFVAGIGAYTGHAMATGDLNGDGLADTAIGAPLADSDAGTAHIIFGRSTSAWEAAGLEGDVVVSGGDHPALAGASVEVADIIGGGVAALIVGAPGAAGIQADGAGAVAVFHGRLQWPDGLSLSEADLTLMGESPGGVGSAAGVSIAAGCDVDGDGRGDLIVGAANHSAQGERSGRVYLLTATARLTGAISLSVADGIWSGEGPEDGAGTVVACAGDLDGDGYDDILAGAPGYDSRRGRAYLLYGGPGPWATSGSVAQWDARFTGAVVGDEAGASLATMPAGVNGAAPAIAVGMPGWDTRSEVDGSVQQANRGAIAVISPAMP